MNEQTRNALLELLEEIKSVDPYLAQATPSLIEFMTRKIKSKVPPKSRMQIAKELGITRQAVDSWFKGKSKPPKNKIGRVAEVLDMSIEEVSQLFKKESSPQIN